MARIPDLLIPGQRNISILFRNVVPRKTHKVEKFVVT